MLFSVRIPASGRLVECHHDAQCLAMLLCIPQLPCACWTAYDNQSYPYKVQSMALIPTFHWTSSLSLCHLKMLADKRPQISPRSATGNMWEPRILFLPVCVVSFPVFRSCDYSIARVVSYYSSHSILCLFITTWDKKRMNVRSSHTCIRSCWASMWDLKCGAPPLYCTLVTSCIHGYRLWIS